MLRNLIIFALFSVLIGVGYFAFVVVPQSLTRHGAVVEIGDVTFRVDVADGPISRSRGLSGRKELLDGEGMLFVFDYPGAYGFWMKDMNFPLDIIWISGDKVVGVSENLPPNNSEDRPVYYPPVPVDKALEIAAGEVAGAGIKTGDEVVVR